VRYIGSKRALLHYIDYVLDLHGMERPGLRVLDAFAGTGVVGEHLRKQGSVVTGNDILFFSYLRQIALLTVSSEPTFDGVEDCDGPEIYEFLLDVRPRRGFLTRLYTTLEDEDGLNYFDERVARWADGALAQIARWWSAGRLLWAEHATLISSLIETLDRAANTAGVYAAHLKTPPRVARISRFRKVLCTDGPIGSALNSDVLDVVTDTDADLAYFDPPYNTRQYSGYYHVPEIVARLPLADPMHTENSLVNTTRMLPFKNSSPFSSKRKVVAAFMALFESCTTPTLLLSYSDDGLVSQEAIVEMLSTAGWNVWPYAVPHQRYKSQKKVSSAPVREHLIFAER
jgi:adenine-specific DNA-methyltransferase